MKKFEKYIVKSTTNIRGAIQHIDQYGEGFVYVINNEGNIAGLITDGDFRRAILDGISLDVECLAIANKDFVYLEYPYTNKEVINCFLTSRIQNLPVLEDGTLKEILFRKNFNLENKVVISNEKREMPIIIMAGGKGTRMKPFTNILPKPLIPIGDRSMLEVIMDEYNLYFKGNFHLSVNHKANLIKAYLEEFENQYNISYITEDKPLGTGGALKYLTGKLKNPFFVSNCDILIKEDYNSIYDSHIENKNDLTIIASMVHYKVPYGVCEISNGGELTNLVEKPEYDFLVNAGMYILNPHVLELIPENTFYNITDLIQEVQKTGGRVGVFPVSEKSYLDSGQWKEYSVMLDKLNKE